MLISDSEYFVPTAQSGKASLVEQCGDLWHQDWEAVEYHPAAILIHKVKSHVSEWLLWSGHQPIRMLAGIEFAHRLTAKGAEAYQDSEWSVKKIVGVRILARTVQRQVATDTLHMAEQYPNKSIQVSHVAVHRKHAPLEECIRLSAHEIVAGSAKCTKCLQVCGKEQLRVWLQTTCIPWQAKDAAHPAAAWFASPRPAFE